MNIPNFEPEYPAITRMAQSVSLYSGMSMSSGFAVVSTQKLHSASIHGLFNSGHNFVITGNENMNNYLNAMVTLMDAHRFVKFKAGGNSGDRKRLCESNIFNVGDIVPCIFCVVADALIDSSGDVEVNSPRSFFNSSIHNER